MSGSEVAGILVAIGLMAVLVALAIRFILRGGKAKLKVGSIEGSFDASVVEKIDSMHEQVAQINEAVNHRRPGEPTLIELMVGHIEETAKNFDSLRIALTESEKRLAEKLETHIESAVAWQTRIEEALPGESFPPRG